MSHYQPIEDLEVFKIFEQIARWAWVEVASWDTFARNTVGSQLIRAVDSIGANIAEGDGRHGDADAVKFFIYARGSAKEARLWIVRAKERNLISEDVETQIEAIDIGLKLLNGLISFRRKSIRGIVREEVQVYDA